MSVYKSRFFQAYILLIAVVAILNHGERGAMRFGVSASPLFPIAGSTGYMLSDARGTNTVLQGAQGIANGVTGIPGAGASGAAGDIVAGAADAVEGLASGAAGGAGVAGVEGVPGANTADQNGALTSMSASGPMGSSS